MRVLLNDQFFVNMSRNERIKTILHELGHVLGLDEFTGKEESNNVMCQGLMQLTKLGPADIGAYREK